MHPDPNITHAYLGFFRCGHMNYMAVDDPTPSERESLGEDLAEIIKNGGTITRVTLEQARETHLGCPDECPSSWKSQKETVEKIDYKKAAERDVVTRVRTTKKK